MKKLVFGTIGLLMLCTGLARADRIVPGETPWWKGLDTLSEEEKLKECQELKRGNVNIEKEYSVLPTKKKWDMLGCEQLLKEQTKANPQTTSNTNTPEGASGTTDDKHDMRAYGLAGGLVVLLFASALILLLRTRKPMKILSAIVFLMLFGGFSAWADLIAPDREFKPTRPPEIRCTDEYCVARTAPQEEFSYKILYIGLGVSVLIVGGAAFILLRKKRKK